MDAIIKEKYSQQSQLSIITNKLHAAIAED